MIVTDKKYMIEDQLLAKLDLMVKRLKGSDDVVLIVDGDEGQGKTEFTFGICYYMAKQLKRKYTTDNIFFNLDEVIKFASQNKEQIIHFDEATLGLMRTQWQKESQQKFLQLVMVARKKKHFIVLCIPKFHRLPPYVIEDRSIGLVHIYSHRNIHKGRYCYFTKQAKAKLYEDYKKRNIQSYQKTFSFRGRFVEASKKIFTEKDIDAYDYKKDQAILSVGEEKKGSMADRWLEQRNNIIRGMKKELKLSALKMRNILQRWNVDINHRTIREICPTQKIKRQEAVISPLL